MNLNYLIILIFFSLLLISKIFKNLMMTLIMLEILMINIMTTLLNMNIMMNMNEYLIIYFLIMMVCESVLALSMLIIFVRFTGNDFFKNKSMLMIK